MTDLKKKGREKKRMELELTQPSESFFFKASPQGWCTPSPMILLSLKRVFNLLLELFAELEANSLSSLTGGKSSFFESGSDVWKKLVSLSWWTGCWHDCLPHLFPVSRAKCNYAIMRPHETLVGSFKIFLLFILNFINLVTNTVTWFKFRGVQ